MKPGVRGATSGRRDVTALHEDPQPLRGENAELRARLAEAEQTLEAIRTGQVDAVVVSGPQGDQVFTLAGADRIYRVVLETMSGGALTVARDGTILFCNRQFATLMRTPMEEVVGRSVGDFMAVAQAEAMAGIVVRARTGPARGRLVMRAGDGTLVHVHVAVSLLPEEAGDAVCVIVNDLTEVEAQEQSLALLRRQQQVLEERDLELRRATEQLRCTAEELTRSNHDLEQFAYVASHDLQEPLRMIDGFLKLLEQRSGSQFDEKAKEYVGYAVQGAARMAQLIGDLLEYSRVGRVGRAIEPTDAAEALHAAMANLQSAIDEAHASVTHDPMPGVLGDARQLMQLFQNLISNAVKFRSPERPCQVHVGVRPKEDAWEFSVRDNGIGIAPEQHDRVFVIFQRLHTREQYAGTGIGLAVCKRIVERHGGRIWLESSPGQGSTFHFTLPAGPGAKRAVP